MLSRRDRLKLRPGFLPVAACCLAAALAGCGSDRASRGEGTVTVAATIAPVADIVRNAGGRRVRVDSLVPPGRDPHRWRPDGETRAAVAEADLVVRAGGDVDEWLADALAGAPNVPVVDLLPRVDPLPDSDPHWWHDPVRVEVAVKEIRNELARADVPGAGYYEAASADYLERLRTLDRRIRVCISVAEIRGKRLVAQHDGFAYFSDRYRVDIVGPDEDGDARVGRRLWADTLGPPGTPAGSYIGALGANVATIVEALAEKSHSCRPRA